MKNISLLLALLLTLSTYSTSGWCEQIVLDPAQPVSDLRLISVDRNGLEIELAFPNFETTPVRVADRDFVRLSFQGAGSWGEFGCPELPVIRKLVRLPERTGWHWEIVNADFIELQNFDVAPLQEEMIETPDGPREPETSFNESAYLQDRWYPENPLELGRPVIMRDFRLGSLELRPILYNPVSKVLRIYRNITVKITFSGSGENPITHPRAQKSRVFSQLVNGNIINAGVFDNTDDIVLGGYLIIAPQTLVNSAWLNEFVEWKRQKGYPCTLVSTSVTGSSSTQITEYVQSIYDTSPNPPDFLVLVGDNDYGMPTHYYSYTGNASDLPYTLLEGTDYFPDMLAGRLSVDSDLNLTVVCSKSVNYERNPVMTSTEWFTRGLMVYDYNGSLSCKNVKERCADLLLENGYTEVAHVSNPPYYYGASYINPQINNQGVTFVNYRGYGSYSSWSPPNYSISNMNDLNNGFRLPIITSIVCGGGNFVSSSYDPCFGENWIRLGSSASNVRGAVVFMGPTSLYTHTKWNNCIDGGIYQGICEIGVTDVASALLNGKMELYYGMPHNQGPGGTTSSVECYFYIYNILGDPGLQMWTGVPQYLTVDHADNLPLSVNYFEVDVAVGTAPAEEALVCVYNGTHDFQMTELTDENGQALFDLGSAPAGEYDITVTGKNLHPYRGTLTIAQEAVALAVSDFTVDDDMSGESVGDGDGLVNPGETIELVVTLENSGNSQTATSINGIASTEDPYASITQNSLTGPDAAPGGTSLLNDDFNVVISQAARHTHVIPISLHAVSAQGNWTNLINLEVVAPLAEAIEYEVQNASGYLSPGEMAEVSCTLLNSGDDPLLNCTGTLISPDDKLLVSDASGSWGDINPGFSAENTTNTFSLQAMLNCPPGWTIPLELIVSADGYQDTLTVAFVVGQVTDEDPAGPDSYGYYCFDSRDGDYDQVPTYEWFEASTQPGQETLPLPDYGSEDDCSVAKPLPFDFTYYGVTYDSITVCSNGWICMGKHANYHSFRNWNIPGALGPPDMIAAFWDDLRLQYGGTVHYFYDFMNYRQVIEWKNTRTAYGSGTNTFEIFLYDPSYWASETGDGIIVFQYQDFHNADASENYATVGIENHEQSDGVNVTYANIYSRGSAILQDGVALLFTTDIDYSGGALDIDVTLTPYGTPIVIPPGGGSFDYNIAATNNETTQEDFSVWCNVTLPDGSIYGPVLGPVTATLLPGMTVNRDRTQTVPGSAPYGSYQYNAYVGEYPGIIYDSDNFEFNKQQGMVDPLHEDWANDGDPFTEETIEPVVGTIPESYALLSVMPNPFNPTTTLRYALPEASRASLLVYDLSGRTVAALVDGWRDAGVHEVTFDGTSLASGIYFYRLKAGGFSSVGKMLLIK